MKKTFFISTAIDYPSEKPHLGHALEKIQADVLARHKRIQRFEVHFSIGTDEHGLKIQKRAQEKGKLPQEFVDEMSKYFKDLWKIFNISNDDFIRTTEKRHEKTVINVFKKIYEKSDIYKGKYKGLYCVDCETYYLAKDLKGDLCPVHHQPVKALEEDTYFFKMGKYQKQLLKHIKNNENFIVPKGRRNEILNRLKEPLQDLSISREAVEWGIPLPIDKKFTFFVWVDALTNYLSTINYPHKEFKKFWPADIHIIGKDILWHHAVIWVSLLLSLELPLPKKIFAHGFITAGGQKMSKSLGNVIDPRELVKKYGVDAVRYFLLREFSSVEDGDFTYEKFEARYNADLANGLGNLVQRTIGMIDKYFSGQMPWLDIELKKSAKAKKESKKPLKNISKIGKKIDELKFDEALKEIWQLIASADIYINENKPWLLVKENPKKLEKVLSNLRNYLLDIAWFLTPFMPETAKSIKEVFEGRKIKSISPLFPRIS
ncbi:MAG: methionyl-tRNA synthetase [Parcubacteria group bacterium Athens1014_10]|nr:MAG: methionyl-tRNA synthetase [Parcubacteria group bacterium Athens1014_10]TSD05522.1 MAG: methionyl-tRNA synthetase [Parcubacteria group bacterium Athens0714_12]